MSCSKVVGSRRGLWAALAVAVVVSGCGGSSGGGGSTPAPAANVAAVAVDAGPAALPTASLNVLFVTVTLCTPGGATCATIDHINVDTGSTGLRILASALPSSLSLPVVNDTTTNAPLAECIQFADGYSWGSLRTADLRVAGEQASNLTVHVIGDAALPTVPTDCVNSGPSQIAENTVEAFGANGILGIGTFHEDCGPACSTGIVPGTYYICPTADNCQNTTMAVTQQVQQPVSHFATDNNGVIVQLPSIGSAGETEVAGALIFGIDTQNNNALGSAAILRLDLAGNFVTQFSGQTLANSFIDSGSNGYFFPDSSLPACAGSTGFYCPTTVQTLSATNQSASGAVVMSTVQFNVANADTLLKNNPTFNAFDNIGGNDMLGGSFDWGLPFFFGRRVFVAIENAGTSAGNGPFYAY
jgi:hypothetical protein